MKILIVSNLYPPDYLGGYELRCALVAEGLRRAGHDIRVLTSRFGLEPTDRIEDRVSRVRVERVLGQYDVGPQEAADWPYFLAMVRPQLRDAHNFIRIVDEFKPDVINWWSVRGLTKAILSIPSFKEIPDVFYVEEAWIPEEQARGEFDERPPWGGLWSRQGKPWYWQGPILWFLERWKSQLRRKGIETSWTEFCPRHVCFVSDFMRTEFEKNGVRYPSSEVLYGGVSVDDFYYEREGVRPLGQPVRFLYAGQIDRERGLHTAIEAFSVLAQEARSLATLTIVGEAYQPRYQLSMQEQVRALGLSEKIVFLGKKTYEEMPAIYRSHDVLIAPSLRKEGLPLSMVEAMLSGCAVVTTGSGGAMEIVKLADLPLFPKGDAPALAQILVSLIQNRDALDRIAKRGQEVALREFSSNQMVQRLCNTFQNLCEQMNGTEFRANSIAAGEHDVESVAHGQI